MSESPPAIYIWVRTSVDWQDETAFYAQLPPKLEDCVQLWNRTFKLPFHLFRYRVQEIARLNLARVEGAVCAPWDAIPEGALVVPVDDDDWFAPTLAATLARESESGISGYHWHSNFLEVPINLRRQAGQLRRWLQPDKPPFWLCATNNYAMIKQVGSQTLLRKHSQASSWFESRRGVAVKEINQQLSLMNRTLSSTTAMDHKRPPFAREKFVLAWHRYRHLYGKRVSPELAWSQPYQEMMGLLLEELR